MIAFVIVVMVLMAAGLFGTESKGPPSDAVKIVAKTVQLVLFTWSIYLLVSL